MVFSGVTLSTRWFVSLATPLKLVIFDAFACPVRHAGLCRGGAGGIV